MLHLVLNPLILGISPDSAGNTLGVPQVAAATAFVGGVLSIIMGLWAKHPFAIATGLGVNNASTANDSTSPIKYGGSNGIQNASITVAHPLQDPSRHRRMNHGQQKAP